MDGARRRSVILLVALCCLLSAAAAPVAGTPSQAWGAQSVDPDQVYLHVDLQANGDAEWTVAYRMRLDQTNETEAFEDLQRDVERNESKYLGDFSARIRDTVAAAENATGRDMAATNFTVSAEIRQIPQKYGVLTYTFTWQNFGVREGDRLTAGDALAGFFLDSETSLAVEWPTEFGLVDVSPEPDTRERGKVVWRGPRDFGEGEPRLVLSKQAATTTTTTTATTTEPPGGTPGAEAGGLPVMLVGVALVAALAAVGAFLYFRRGRGGGPVETPGGGGGPGAGGEPGAAEGAGGAPSETAEGGAAAGAEGAAGAGAGAGSEEPPEELLSNEERVKRFLRERGGRAKQQEIVEGLGWTDAKTSQVLSGMESDDEIEKFRIGRENVVKLPDAEFPD